MSEKLDALKERKEELSRIMHDNKRIIKKAYEKKQLGRLVKRNFKKVVVLAGIVTSGTIAITSLAIKGSKSETTNNLPVVATTTELVTTEDKKNELVPVVQEDRIDEIIDSYNKNSDKKITRNDLGIIEVGKNPFVCKKNINGEDIYYLCTEESTVPIGSESVDIENVNGSYCLIDAENRNPIAGIADISGVGIVNMNVESYFDEKDNSYKFRQGNKYVKLNPTLDEYEAISNYFDERVELKR